MVAVSSVPTRTHSATLVVPVRVRPVRLVGPAYYAMKARVVRRDGPACHYCGRRIGTRRYASTLDHVWPVSLGGLNRAWNLVLACPGCNSMRGSDVTWCDCPAVCGPAVVLGPLAASLADPAVTRGA